MANIGYSFYFNFYFSCQCHICLRIDLHMFLTRIFFYICNLNLWLLDIIKYTTHCLTSTNSLDISPSSPSSGAKMSQIHHFSGGIHWYLTTDRQVLDATSKIQNRLRVYELKRQYQSSRAQKYIVRHSNIVLSFGFSSHMISLTNENTVLL